MSQFSPALAYVLNWEDPQHEYASNPDVGGFAIAGVNSAAWPEDYAKIAAAAATDRPMLVNIFYGSKFWAPLQIGGISDQDTASRVLDQSVNGGRTTGTQLLQRAANACGAMLIVDGITGSKTFDAVNALDPERLLAAYRTERVARYEAIAAADPAKYGQYLAGWIKRALA